MRQMSGTSDMIPGRTSSGIEAFKERHARIIISPPGSNPKFPAWGFGVRTYIGKDIRDDGDLRSVEAIARAAHLQDPETADAKVSITRVDGSRFKYSVKLTTKSGVVATVEREVQVTL